MDKAVNSDGPSEPSNKQTCNKSAATSDNNKSTVNGMVRDKEKEDATDNQSPDGTSKKSRSWVETKSAKKETTIKKALGIDRHPDDDKRRDKHGNSRSSDAESTKDTSMVGFSEFGKAEKWAADQVKVANAQQGHIDTEHKAKKARDKTKELCREAKEL